MGEKTKECTENNIVGRDYSCQKKKKRKKKQKLEKSKQREQRTKAGWQFKAI